MVPVPVNPTVVDFPMLSQWADCMIIMVFRRVGSVHEKHIHVYGLVSSRDLILFIFHDIALVARSTKLAFSPHPSFEEF